MLLDYAGNGNPDSVIWSDEFGNEYDVETVMWSDKNRTRKTIVWQKYLELTIPDATAFTDLTAYASTRNPNNIKKVRFIVEAGTVVGEIVSGSLSDFTSVELLNKGSIQGRRTSGNGNDALVIRDTKVKIKLINIGTIYGAGGRGGHGGAGANISTESYTDSAQAGPSSTENGAGGTTDKHHYGVLKYSYSGQYIIGWYWNDVLIHNQAHNTPAESSLPRSGNTQYFKGSNYAYLYTSIEGNSIIKRTFNSSTSYGGIGGTGGYGQGFSATRTNGLPGKVVSGNNGGSGGNGGTWGASGTAGLNGQGGGTSGKTNGYIGGQAIAGKSNLTDDSTIGTTLGGVS